MKKIAIFGVPRSGTSWLSQIFNSHPEVVMRFQPLFSYGHKGRIKQDSTADDIEIFFDEILHTSDEFAMMASSSHKNYPVFNKSSNPTHISFKETRYINIVGNLLNKCRDIIVIGIVRNPHATITSWINAPKEFNKEWNIYEEWRSAPSKNMGRVEEYFGFDKWKEAASDFIEYEINFAEQFKLVRYDLLIAQPEKVVSDVFSFSGLQLDPQVTEFLSDSRERHDEDPYSVFRAKANDDNWHNILPNSIAEEIFANLKSTNLEIFL